jgi:hypothetical protein
MLQACHRRRGYPRRESKTIKEIMRCLKRNVAREVYKALVIHPHAHAEIINNQAAA